MKIQILGFMIVLVPFLCGCGSADGPELGTVKGVVTLDGDPLADVRVIFNPGTVRPSEGWTDEQGRYELTYTRQRQGAVLGNHKVFITSIKGVDEDGNEISDEKETVPEQYNSKTTLSEEVKAGSNEINFELKS